MTSQRSLRPSGLEPTGGEIEPGGEALSDVPYEKLWDAGYNWRRLDVLVDGQDDAVSIWRQLGVPLKQSQEFAVYLLDALKKRRGSLTRERELVAFTEPQEMLEALMESNRGRLQEKEQKNCHK